MKGFADFVQKKKKRIFEDKEKKQIELSEANSIKNILSTLNGKIFCEDRCKDKDIQKEKKEKIKDLPKVDKENNGLELDEIKIIKQYYDQKLDDKQLRKIPKAISSIIHTNKEKSHINKPNKEVVIISQAKESVYQVKRFESNVTSNEILEYFSEKIGNENIITIKRIKNENKIFTGIVLLTVKNTKKVIDDLTSKRLLFKGKKLKISLNDSQ
jgi:hypothetical protein